MISGGLRTHEIEVLSFKKSVVSIITVVFNERESLEETIH